MSPGISPLETGSPASGDFRPNDRARFPLTLGVVGHAPHWIGPDGRSWAYEPYVREMRSWADLFRSVRLCSPAAVGPMRGNLAPYERLNVEWCPVDYPLTPGTRGALSRLVRTPGLIAAAGRMVRDSDFVLLRSPGHFGMAGALWVRALGRASLTKWAGENGAYAGERLLARLERWLQSVPSSRNPVLVYGPPRRRHQVEALPALMTREELAHAAELASARRWTPPWRLMSIGRLSLVKGFDLAIRGLGELARRRPDLSWTYVLVGDGPEAGALRRLAEEEGIAARVRLVGARPFAEAQKEYGEAHLAIMPGTKEGWPKVIAEAWAHGAVPVAARGGIVPWILREAESGRVFEPSPEGLADALAELMDSPAAMEEASRRGFERAPGLSLEHFRSLLEGVLVERCGL